MERARLISLMIFCSIGSSVIGLPYICSIYGFAQDVAVKWGILSVFVGLLLLCSTAIIDNLQDNTAKGLLMFEFSSLCLLQLVPIYFWFNAHGNALLVSTTSKYTAHWGFSVPHLVLFSIGLVIVYHIFNDDLILENV